MSNWQRAFREWTVSLPGRRQESKITVSGCVDTDEDHKAKLLIENHPENQGPSIRDAGVMAAAITDIADSMGIKVDEVEWYALDSDDEMYQLDVEDEMRMSPHPQWQQLANSGDLNHRDLAEAKKAYPDHEQRVVTAEWNPIQFDDAMRLAEAFEFAEANMDAQPALEGQQAFDLTREYFQSRQQEQSPEFDLEFDEPYTRHEPQQPGMDASPGL